MMQTKDLSALNEDLTPEVIAQVDEIIDRHVGQPGSLIPVLTECQQVAKYLPVELQEYIGERMNVPGSAVFGVVTFYSFFTMVPKGRHSVRCCMGTACYVKRMGEILSRIRSNYELEIGATSEDKRFSLEAVRCLGACGLAPVVVVDDDTFGGVEPDKILDILEQYE